MGVESILSHDKKIKHEVEDHLHSLQSKLKLKKEFFEFLPYLIVIVKIDGTILDLNTLMAESLGRKKHRLIGENILDFFPNDVALHRQRMAEKVILTKKSVEFTDSRNGQFFKSQFFPIVEENKKVDKIIAVIQNITEEKKQEKIRVEHQEQYFESLIENTLDLITVVNQQGIILYESPSLQKLLYFTPEERKNQNVFDNIHSDDLKRVKNFFNNIVSQPGITKKISFRIKDRKGKWHYFESLGNNQLHNPQINGLIINSRDITHRVQEEKQKNAILDNTSEIIAYHDKNHTLIWANKAYQKATGLNLDELVGKKCYHAWGLDSACSKCPLTKALKTGQTVEAVFSPDNQKQWPSYFKTWKIIGDPVIDDYGNIIGAIELSYDITRERKANEEMKRSKEHLEKLIHNTIEIIFSINPQFKVTLWNKTAENVTGIKAKNIVGKDIRKQDFVENGEEVNKFLIKQYHHEPSTLKRMMVKTLFGSNRIFQVSTSLVKDNKGDITDIIFICNDITLKNKMHGTLIPGVSYLIDDDEPDDLIDLINSLVSKDQKGLFITRSSIKNYFQLLDLDDITLLLLADKTEKIAPSVHSLYKLKESIHHFVTTHKRSVICLDRTDYLFTSFGFQDTVKTLYDVNDSVKKNQAILLLRLNSRLFSKNEYEVIKEEYALLPSAYTDHVYLDDKLFDTLFFVYEQNRSNEVVYQKSITHHFSISKVTAQKRIKELVEKDLIFYRKQGRIKQLLITDKGKQLLNKRQ
jgi:PAS domain S-box-containing protein